MTTIDIGWPAKALWPNGRPGHHMQESRLKKSAKADAHLLTRAKFKGGIRPRLDELVLEHGASAGRIPVTIFCRYKNESHRPDEDNTVAVCKAALDGMAEALGVDDKLFLAPRVEFLKDSKCRRTLILQVGRP